MKTVYKYEIKIQDEFVLELPKIGEGIHVGLDPNGQSSMWICHDTEEEKVMTKFYVRGTGHTVPEDGIYINSWKDGPFMWHLFIAEDWA